jgi:uncharacterized integral membrane protein
MFRKVLAAIVLIPLAVVIVGLAVANRQVVTISFDPFNAAAPAFALKAPLFVLVFILIIVGVIIGGAAAWLRQSKWRRTARRLDAELRREQAELDALKRRVGEHEAATASWPPPRALQPPAA